MDHDGVHDVAVVATEASTAAAIPIPPEGQFHVFACSLAR